MVRGNLTVRLHLQTKKSLVKLKFIAMYAIECNKWNKSEGRDIYNIDIYVSDVDICFLSTNLIMCFLPPKPKKFFFFLMEIIMVGY